MSGPYSRSATVTIFVTGIYGNKENTSESVEWIETSNVSELRRNLGKPLRY
jgi:hypothetical protein